MRHQTFPIVLCILWFLSAPAAYGAGPIVTLDSISGAAEVQRAGSTVWQPIALNGKLYNNDVVRINSGGVGRLRWPDQTVAFMRGGSQLLVNIGPAAGKTRLMSYATVFVGSVFFIVKKVLPGERPGDMDIYTPTSVMTIRGTSFVLDVAPDSGTTGIKMICGTMRVRCIKKNSAILLSAPYKTVVGRYTDPIEQSALLGADLDSLRSWVPRDVVDAEVAAQLAQAKRDRIIIAGSLDEQCIIAPFVNASKYGGAWDIGRAVPRMLAVRLPAAYNRLTVAFADTACTSGAALAAQKKARYVIAGTISFLDIIDHAEITVRADEYRERSIGRITIDLSIYDAAEKSVIYTATVTGERTGKKSGVNSWSTIGKLPFDLENKQFASSIIGSALDQALDAAVEKIAGEFGK